MSRANIARLTALVAFLFLAAPIADHLVPAVGGPTDNSYTSLSFVDPTRTSLATRAGETVEVELMNASDDEERYAWKARLDGKIIRTGTVVVAAQQQVLLSVNPESSGRLVITLEGTDISIHTEVRR